MKVFGKQRKQKMQTMSSRRRSEIIFLCCIFALPIIHKCIFYIGGNLQSFFLAFEKFETSTSRPDFAKFENFKMVLYDLKNSSVWKTCITNTLYLYIMETFLSIPLSLLCSFFVLKKVPGSGALKVIFFLPSMVSSVVMVLMYKYFCSYAVPEIAQKVFGVKRFPIILQDYPYAFPMILGYNLWTGFAGGIVMYLGQMSTASDGVLDAAKIDGVTVWGEFWHIILPAVYPLLSVYLITGFVSIFTGGGPLYTFYKERAPRYTYTTGYFLFTKVMGENSTQMDYPYAATVGILITLIATPLTFLVKYVLEHVGPREE